ncbi:serine/threonine-protein kinase, partial [Streptomyces sp. NPDC058272]
VLYIAMRYVSGLDLRALLDRDGPLTVGTALRIAAQVASALDAAHGHDLVHRDVKPGNILVAQGTDSDHPEHVYLTDFGLTKKSLSLTGFTTVGEFVGTLDYVAPEQISGRPVDGRCDLYSLACVVYETLAGGPPFQREEDIALLWAHQYDQPPALSEKRPGIEPGLDAVLAKALAKVPEDRYSSCLEFVAALRAAARGAVREASPLDSLGGTGVRSPGPPPEPPAWARPVFGRLPG